MKEYFGSFNYRREDGKPFYDPPELEVTAMHPLTVDGVALDHVWYADTTEGIAKIYCDAKGNPGATAVDESATHALPAGVEAIPIDGLNYLLSKTVRGHVQIWGDE